LDKLKFLSHIIHKFYIVFLLCFIMVDGREISASELEFLGSMVGLGGVPTVQQGAGGTYDAGARAYNCDPCDGCGADACTSCSD